MTGSLLQIACRNPRDVEAQRLGLARLAFACSTLATRTATLGRVDCPTRGARNPPQRRPDRALRGRSTRSVLAQRARRLRLAAAVPAVVGSVVGAYWGCRVIARLATFCHVDPTRFRLLASMSALVFLASGCGSSGNGLFVVNPEGGGPRKVFSGCINSFAWSPDGNSIALIGPSTRRGG